MRNKGVNICEGFRTNLIWQSKAGSGGGQMVQFVRARALSNKVAGSIPTQDHGLRPLQLKTENRNWTWS